MHKSPSNSHNTTQADMKQSIDNRIKTAFGGRKIKESKSDDESQKKQLTTNVITFTKKSPKNNELPRDIQ